MGNSHRAGRSIRQRWTSARVVSYGELVQTGQREREEREPVDGMSTHWSVLAAEVATSSRQEVGQQRRVGQQRKPDSGARRALAETGTRAPALRVRQVRSLRLLVLTARNPASVSPSSASLSWSRPPSMWSMWASPWLGGRESKLGNQSLFELGQAAAVLT